MNLRPSQHNMTQDSMTGASPYLGTLLLRPADTEVVSSPPSPETLIVLSAQTGEPFQYCMPQHPDSIRLLKLEPSETGTDVLTCWFLDLALSTKPEYEVLSGFWGHQKSLFRSAPLIIDGYSCKTTPELATALFRFRLLDRPRLLWIQALAINIYNIGERSGQIKMLRNILTSARRLVVWLGGDADNSELVFEHQRRMGHLRSQYEPSWPQDAGPGFFKEAFHAIAVETAAAAAPERWQVYSTAANAAFQKLCLRPWFYRPWTIPELALCRDTVVACGEYEVGQLVSHINPLSCLFRSYQSPSRPSTTPSSPTSLYGDLNIPVVSAESHFLSLAFLSRQHNTVPPMANAYRIVQNCRATDRRDSVFAIAALEPDLPVPIDYQHSVSEVYQNATVALIHQHRSLQVLRRLGSTNRSPDLPSWTLDFNSPLQTTSLWILPGARFGFYYQSGNDDEEADAKRRGLWPYDSQVPEPHLDPQRHPSALLLTGMHMKTIAATGPIMPAAVAIAAVAVTATTTDQPTDNSVSSTVLPNTIHHHHQEFMTILQAWETLALTTTTATITANNNNNNNPQPQPQPQHQYISDAFFDTLIAHDAHDVHRNDPPRPPVSSEADRARRWYARCYSHQEEGKKEKECWRPLHRAEPDYFALAAASQGGTGDGDGDGVERPAYCLPAGPPAVRESYRNLEEKRHALVNEVPLFGRRVARACAGRRFFVTVEGGMGLAPAEAREGCAVAFFPTGHWPMFLQPDGCDGGGEEERERVYYRYLGEGFLYDWWRYVARVFEHRNKRLLYPHLVTEFAIR